MHDQEQPTREDRGQDHQRRQPRGPVGLYDPANEHDACGVGFVLNLDGRPRHEIVLQGIEVLVNLMHRGATGADPLTGDGAGLLIQIPDRFFREELARTGLKLPPAGAYGAGMFFLPQDPARRAAAKTQVEVIAAAEGLEVLGFATTTEPLGDRLYLQHCPFADLARQDRSICRLHHEMLRGFFDELDTGVSVRRLDVFVRDDLCVAHLDRPDLRPAPEPSSTSAPRPWEQ